MRVLDVRGIKIGEGRPKICVPIVGKNMNEIIEEARAIKESCADMAEWRADFFECIGDIEKFRKCIKEIRMILYKKPLLFTLRSAEEGGESRINDDMYVKLNEGAAEYADIIDIELFRGDKTVCECLEKIHEKGAKVLMSNHDFKDTPEKDEIINRLRMMEKFGADICKIAVMPKDGADVLKLMDAACEYKAESKMPVVAISMQGRGIISRISGEIFGSDITFASLNKSSAPGQININELKYIIDIIHKGI